MVDEAAMCLVSCLYTDVVLRLCDEPLSFEKPVARMGAAQSFVA